MLMDEPLANLDSLTRIAMQTELMALWQRERFTAFLVTHDVEEALFLAERVLVLSERPARVLSEIAVDLPYPRHRGSPRFTALRQRGAGRAWTAVELVGQRIEGSRETAPWNSTRRIDRTYWAGLMHEFGPALRRTGRFDATPVTRYVAENFAELKARGVLAAGVPAELGGGGASYPELCEMLRVLARYCGSTALTLSMHTHPLAALVWRWRRDPAPVERFLRRVV